MDRQVCHLGCLQLQITEYPKSGLHKVFLFWYWKKPGSKWLEIWLIHWLSGVIKNSSFFCLYLVILSMLTVFVRFLLGQTLTPSIRKMESPQLLHGILGLPAERTRKYERVFQVPAVGGVLLISSACHLTKAINRKVALGSER